MATLMFVNLPVKNLDQSMAFFKRLGFQFNPQFTNEQAACMIVSDTSYVMLLVEDFFKTFTDKPLVDANRATEVLVCLSAQDRAGVDAMVAKAVAAGGKAHREPVDHGFMYGHGFEDLDGHQWEVMFMEASAVEPVAAASAK
ncbi:VOC family protein [Variovorax sp. LARHSF232]